MDITKRFLIYKGSGGLAHNLNSLMTAIDICETQTRTLIIDMESNLAFHMKFSKIFVIKDSSVPYYDSYDVIPNTTTYKGKTMEELAASRLQFKQDQYFIFGENISNIDKNIEEDVVVYSGWNTNHKKHNIQVTDEILEMLQKEEPLKGKYISCHFRNTDMKNNIQKMIERIQRICEQTNIHTLYLASDDNESYDIILQHIPKLNIIRKTIPEKNIKNLHYTSKNKFEEIYNCLRDIYYVVKSSFFLPSFNSGLSWIMINVIYKDSFIIPNIQSTTQVIR
jgi:hypothetical protein